MKRVIHLNFWIFIIEINKGKYFFRETEKELFRCDCIRVGKLVSLHFVIYTRISTQFESIRYST